MDVRHFLGQHAFNSYEYNQLTEITPSTPEEEERRGAIIDKLRESQLALLEEFLPERIVLSGNISATRIQVILDKRPTDPISPSPDYL